MAYNYDKLYGAEPDALGAPSPVFVEFFETLNQKQCRVLDIGCGQGRDALFIARLGHQVVGVDLSPNGIRDLQNAAAVEDLQVTGIVADITEFTPEGSFDIIVIDRTLHMLDAGARQTVLARLLGHVRDAGWLLIEDERSNIDGLRRVIAADAGAWSTHKASKGTLFLRKT
ncbi:MAG: class I SAM-dependent methyltransferase [Pseudomonadota bacterium]